MLQTPAKKSLFQRQIPTILGLVVLVAALIGGVLMIGTGPGVFAPRATPQTTPKQIKVTNVTDSGFTVSFLTDEATAGFVKYGETAGDLQSQSSDDRDQLSGSIGQYQTHHITIRGLKPGTTYFYTLGTGSRASFDDDGQPFQITTAKRAGAPSAAKTAYGSVLTAAGAPADGAIVYVVIQGVGEMSSLVKSSGSYALALSNARTADGSSFAQINDTDTMAVLVQGANASQVSSFSVTVAESQPIATVTLGQAPDLAAAPAVVPDSATTPNSSEQLAGDDTLSADSASTATDSSSLASTTGTGGSDILSEFSAARASSPSSSTTSSTPTPSPTPSPTTATSSAAPQTIDLSSNQEQVITTSSPLIKGMAAPNVVVSIEVNSETQIQQQLIANENGEFELDLEALKAQLEPGEHTATYSYTDPSTGELVTKTVTFTVEEPSSTTQAASTSNSASATNTTSGTGGTSTQLAQATTASPSPTPFGSGNPFSLSPTATSSATTSATTATRSGMPATTSAVPVSGSVGTTFALLIGGFFFITAGIWSFWAAREYGSIQVSETNEL